MTRDSDTEKGAKSTNSAAEFRKAFAACTTGLQDALQTMTNGVQETLNLEPGGKKLQALLPLFEACQRRVLELAETLSTSDTQIHRDGLKSAESVFKMKLASSRTAASVSMKNAAAEMEASFNTTMQKKLTALSSGGAGQLRELQERVEELEAEVQQAKNGANKTEEMLKTIRGLLRGKETEVEEKTAEVERLQTELAESKGGVARATRVLSETNNRMRASLMEAAAEAERASLMGPQECKPLVAALAERLRSEQEDAARKGPGGTEKHDEQLARLLEKMDELQKQLADTKADAEREKVSSRQKIEATTQELKKTQRMLADAQTEMSRASTPGEPDTTPFKQMLADSRSEIDRLKAELGKAKEATDAKQKEIDAEKNHADALQRDMVELLSRAVSESERAAMLSANECKVQVKAMAERLKAELDAARQGATESAHEQLNRLLDELGVMSKTVTELQMRLSNNTPTIAAPKDSAATIAKVKELETNERKTRDMLNQALAEAQLKTAENASLHEKLRQLTSYYRAQQVEATNVRVVLDRSIREMAINISESASLSDKMKQLLEQYKLKSVEAEAVKAALEHARSELAVHMSETANLRSEVKELVSSNKSAYEKEQLLRSTIKQQQASLHAAFVRVNEVTVELQRAKGAAMEERDSLVHTALHALYQLRTHLGSIHALRPEVTRPIDEVSSLTARPDPLCSHPSSLTHPSPISPPPPCQALVVKRAIKTSHSMSSLGYGGLHSSESLPTVQVQRVKPDTRLEAFMDKVADSAFSASAYFPPMSPPKTSPPMGAAHTPPLRSVLNSSSPRMFKSIAQVGVPQIPISRGMLRIPNPPPQAQRSLVDVSPTRSAF